VPEHPASLVGLDVRARQTRACALARLRIEPVAVLALEEGLGPGMRALHEARCGAFSAGRRAALLLRLGH